MNKKAAKKIEDLEKSREEVLDFFKSRPSERFSRKPDEETWSLAELGMHLYLTDKLTLANVKAYWATDKRATGIKEKAKFTLLKQALKSNRKFKAPAVLSKFKEEQKSLPALEEAWRAVHEEWKLFLEPLADKEFRLEAFRHPYAGMMNLYQTLTFIHVHCVHHQNQMHSIDAMLGIS